MADSTDDEFVSGGAEPSNRQSSHSAPNDTGAGRAGRWRCCSSGPPLPNAEAVEDVNDEISVQSSAADEKSVHSQKQQQKNQEAEAEAEEDQEQSKGPAAGPRRWCSSSICSPPIEPATSDHTSEENSFTVQERHIDAAGGLQRLGSVQPDDEQPPTIPAARAETEATGGSETEPVPEPEQEPESDATSQIESTQTDLGDGASLHRRNNSGFLKV